MEYNIAVIGAQTLLGHEIMTALADSDLNIKDISALTPKQLSGQALSFGDDDIHTKDIDLFDFVQTDMAIYCDRAPLAKTYLKKCFDNKIQVIDCSGAFLLDNKIDHVHSFPSATTQQILKALQPLQAHASIKRLVMTTMEATSGEGKDGMDELFNQSRKFFVSDGLDQNVFDKQIAFNVIPKTDEFMGDGQTESEWRLAAEIKNTLDKNVAVTATCVRVPVFMGNAISVNIECHDDMDAKTARDLWLEDHNIIIIDQMSEMATVTPAEIAGEDAVFISRIRNDSTCDNAISFWCVADNIRMPAVNVVEKISKLLQC